MFSKVFMAVPSSSDLDSLQDLARSNRQFFETFSRGVENRISNRRYRCGNRRLAHDLAAKAAVRVVIFYGDHLHVRRFQVSAHLGVAIVGIDRNPGHLIDQQFLRERHADSLHDAAFYLALRGETVENRAAIVSGNVARDLYVTGLRVHLDLVEVSEKTLALDIFLKTVIRRRVAIQIARVLHNLT